MVAVAVGVGVGVAVAVAVGVGVAVAVVVAVAVGVAVAVAVVVVVVVVVAVGVAVAVVVVVAVGVVTDLITIENPPPGLLLPGVLVADVEPGFGVVGVGLWVGIAADDGALLYLDPDCAEVSEASSIALVLSHPDHDAWASRHRVRDFLKERGHEVTTDDPAELRESLAVPVADLAGGDLLAAVEALEEAAALPPLEVTCA